MKNARKITRDWLKASSRTEFNNAIYEAKLTPRETEIIKKRYLEDTPNFVIAMDLDISVETVRNELCKAYDNIHKVI